MQSITVLHQQFLSYLEQGSGLAPLLLRLYLAPIFMQAGWSKFQHFDQTVGWFEHGLGLPFPELMVVLAAGTELIGGALLIPGLAVRIISFPLMATMLVAIFAVHWDHGWLAISDASSWLANDRVMAAAEHKEQLKDLVKTYGDYAVLTKNGSITLLNNGIEFAVTYLIMLLSLVFTGGGRYTSVDYWLKPFFNKP